MSNFLKGLLIFIGGLVSLSSCVPNKRLVYLQHEQEPKRGDVTNLDTAVRTYQTSSSAYTLRAKDIVTIRVASITPAEFDFVQKYEEQLGLIRKLNQYEQSNMAGAGGTGRTGMANANTTINPLALDRMQSGFILDEGGNLELPYIGKVKVAGLTLSQTEQLLEEKLLGYFETPVVRVQMLNFHFTILGEVNNEGRYTLFDPGSNIIDAITLAGNLNDFADRSKIKVVRTEGSEAKIYYVDLLKENLLGQPGYFLRPNDVLVIPPLPARAVRKYTLPTYTTALGLITTTLTLIFFLSGSNN